MSANADDAIRGAPRSADAATRAAFSPITVFLCVVATWIVPGAGHWLLGRRGKALLYFTLIAFTYAFGIWLAAGRNVRLDQDTMDLYFFGESFCGGFTLVAWSLTRGLELTFEQPLLDAGLLFSTVAGLLNLCVMVDVYETARPRPAAAAA
jgi:hypothetical protein